MTSLPHGPAVLPAPALHIPGTQDIQGSALEAASSKTLDANARLAETAKHMGAGQKGARRRMRGGAATNLNAHLPIIPEAGTIKGVSAATNHLANVDNLNQVRAGAMYDKQMNAGPYDPTPTKGGRRTKKHRKSKNGRSNIRTHRRGRNKSHSNRRRSRGVLLKHVGKRK